MITVEEAESIILSNIGELPTETVPLAKCLGRVLRESVRADRDMPPFNRSTMDGICINSSTAATSRTFSIAGTLTAGEPAMILEDPSSCFEIMTGATVPMGADCVIKIEDIILENGVAKLNDGVEPSAGLAIHPQGSDAKKGDELLKTGCRITPKEIAILSSVGKSELLVSSVPRIAIITTGDELVEVEQTPLPHQIRRSNDHTLEAALIAAGYADCERIHILDNPTKIDHEISHLLAEKDVLILTGGISKGKKDFMPDALAKAGVEKHFQWVSQRPGKPLWFGQFSRDGRRYPVFALPGNPVSCFTCLHRYTLPALAKWSGLRKSSRQYARLGSDTEFKPPLSLFLPVRIEYDDNGETFAHPLPFNTSGDFISVAQTDGFIELPKDRSDFTKGEALRYFPWQT